MRRILIGISLGGALAFVGCKSTNPGSQSKATVSIDQSTGQQLDQQATEAQLTLSNLQNNLRQMQLFYSQDNDNTSQILQNIIDNIKTTKQLTDSLKSTLYMLLQDIAGMDPQRRGTFVAKVDTSILDPQVTCPLIELVGRNSGMMRPGGPRPNGPGPGSGGHGWGSDAYRPNCTNIDPRADSLLEQVMKQLAALDDVVVAAMTSNGFENQQAKQQFFTGRESVVNLLSRAISNASMIVGQVRTWRYEPVATDIAYTINNDLYCSGEESSDGKDRLTALRNNCAQLSGGLKFFNYKAEGIEIELTEFQMGQPFDNVPTYQDVGERTRAYAQPFATYTIRTPFGGRYDIEEEFDPAQITGSSGPDRRKGLSALSEAYWRWTDSCKNAMGRYLQADRFDPQRKRIFLAAVCMPPKPAQNYSGRGPGWMQNATVQGQLKLIYINFKDGGRFGGGPGGGRPPGGGGRPGPQWGGGPTGFGPPNP